MQIRILIAVAVVCFCVLAWAADSIRQRLLQQRADCATPKPLAATELVAERKAQSSKLLPRPGNAAAGIFPV